MGFLHADMHWGNALYHDIPAGGCWHYGSAGRRCENTDKSGCYGTLVCRRSLRPKT
jgi:predicted unusual protein kinase regulating ubiquinone biosynthesis (AarF/ABC1/UbiB family)